MAQTPEPQSILMAPVEAAIFLVLRVEEGAEDDVRDLLQDVGGLIRSVGFRIPDGGLGCVVGLGSELWDRLVGWPRPAGLHTFAGVSGARHTAPATQGDLLFHIRAHRADLCFELAQRLVERLRGRAEVVEEVHGFKSFDERDLLGFVDGTENPVGAGAPEAALIAAEDPAFAGGSYVLVQRYVHDLTAWDALSVGEQERVVGRTKLNDIELPDEVKPENSHVALNTIVDEDGRQRQIVRYNMPFGARRRGRIRHVLHRLRPQPGRARGDAHEHVRRASARKLRPHPRLLHGRQRQPVLRAHRRLPRRSARDGIARHGDRGRRGRGPGR